MTNAMINAMKNANAMMECLRGMDNLYEIMAALGMTLDYWAFEHGVSAGELEDGVNGLHEAMVSAHKFMGMPEEPFENFPEV